MSSQFLRLSHAPIFRLAAVIAVSLCFSGPALCGPIHEAAKHGDLDKIKSLLQANPRLVSSVDEGGMTPLHWAAVTCNVSEVWLLLDHNADKSAKDRKGRTAWYVAHTGCFDELVAHEIQNHPTSPDVMKGELEMAFGLSVSGPSTNLWIKLQNWKKGGGWHCEGSDTLTTCFKVQLADRDTLPPNWHGGPCTIHGAISGDTITASSINCQN